MQVTERTGVREGREREIRSSQRSARARILQRTYWNRILSFMPELLIHPVGWGRESALLTSSQVILVVLIQGQCFENFYPKHKRFKPERRLKVAAGTAVDPGRLNLITVFRDRSLTGPLGIHVNGLRRTNMSGSSLFQCFEVSESRSKN